MSTSIVFAVVVGSIIFSIGISISWAYQRIEAYLIRRHRCIASLDEKIFLPEATVAQDLVPMLLAIDRTPNFSLKGASITIFGSDGKYIVSRNGGMLAKGIRRWVAKGARVQYVLLEADPSVRHRFGELISSIGPDNLEVLVLNNDEEGTMSLQEGAESLDKLKKKMRTFHPTLFLGSKGQKAMWIEGLHPPNSTVAYNVTYVSPSVMSVSSELIKKYDSCKRDIDAIAQNCASLSDQSDVVIQAA